MCVAQLSEQQILNLKVPGSIPGTRICIVVHVEWKQSAKLPVVGSIPTRCID